MLLKLKEIIERTYINEASGGVNQDASGKLFELRVGHHLSKQHGLGAITHYRHEDKTPQQIHDIHKKAVGEEAYKKIDNHAKDAASHISKHLASKGHKKLTHVVWTSNGVKDIEHFTGKKDPNNKSDLMVRSKKGEHGISLKYTKTSPVLGNEGYHNLIHHFGGDPKKISDPHLNTQKKTLKGLGYTGDKNHERFKTFRDSTKPAAKAHTEKVNKASVGARTKIAKSFSDHLNTLHQNEFHKHLESKLSSPSVTPTMVHQTNPKNNKQHSYDSEDYHKNALAPHKGHLKAVASGTNVHIHGKGGKKIASIRAASGGQPTQAGKWSIVSHAGTSDDDMNENFIRFKGAFRL
jgi:hypothetical protein